MQKKQDIQSRKDIEKLVRVFYEKLLDDDLLQHFFVEITAIDLTTHLPIIFDFWESVLFQVGKYKNDTLDIHLELNHKYRLQTAHFNRWLELFNQTLDELFEGKKTQEAKDRALSIATII
ncbi:MAG TPA: group III truncated hemoglobin, partial [Phaeodactylibacter sp.]|nr:group III truncated hemoglobin [Phaeodactylibacter sp.]